MSTIDYSGDIAAAWAVREKAHAPYSNFSVGAVAVTPCGQMFRGCNVENLSFGLTNCAERVAIQSAIAAGFTQILYIVVVADTEQIISPCGACRQVMAEFGVRSVISANRHDHELFSIADLLPRASEGILDR